MYLYQAKQSQTAPASIQSQATSLYIFGDFVFTSLVLTISVADPDDLSSDLILSKLTKYL
jgi:hypothetical protein